jgi:malonyl CoA-acyl carrier protein transacylase
VESILAEAGLGGVDLANFNAPGQIVISGLRADIERAETAFQQKDKAFLPLKTGGAFHSRYMQAARDEFEAHLRQFHFAAPTTLVLSNCTAAPYSRDNVAENLANQIARPVRWVECVELLLGRGEMKFEEVGDTNVLTNLVTKIRANAKGASRATATGAAGAAAGITSQRPPMAAEKVRSWNERHPVGVKVRSQIFSEVPLETRTEAMVLFGHRAAVYVHGYNGYFDLDEISPL